MKKIYLTNQILLNLINNDCILLSNEFIYKFFTYDMIEQAIEKNNLIDLITEIISNIRLTNYYLKNKKRDIIYYYFSNNEFNSIFNIDYLKLLKKDIDFQIEDKEIKEKEKDFWIAQLIIFDLNKYNMIMERKIKTDCIILYK